MDVLRKIIGALVLLFIGIPILFSIIWGVGIAKGILSSNSYKEIPQFIASEMPELINELIEEAKINPDSSELDDESRMWLKAMAKTGIPFKEVMIQTGLKEWLDEDFSDSMYLLGKILSGERKYAPIYLNLDKLKKAISSDYLAEYLAKVVKNLPSCNSTEEKFWTKGLSEGNFLDSLPDCSPKSTDIKTLKKLFKNSLIAKTEEIPEKVDILSNNSLGFRLDGERGSKYYSKHRPEDGLRFLRAFNTYSYLLFLIPFFFIFLGAVIADSTLSGFLVWSGGATTIAGVLSLLLHSFVTGIVKAFGIIPDVPFYVNYAHISHFESVLMERIGILLNQILSGLFSKVSNLSFSIILLGIAFIAISFIVKNEKEKDN